mgnify:CR=1 FL=1
MRHEWRLLRVRIPVVDGDNNYDFYCIHCLTIYRLLETNINGLTRQQINLMECVSNER